MEVSGHASPSAIYAVVLTATAVALLAVVLRLYTRLLIVRGIWWDDWLMALAMIFIGGYSICIALETHFGLGRHHDSLTQAQHSKILFCFWLTVYFYQIGLGLAKISIVAQCVRAFGTIRSFKIVAWILAGIITAYTVTTIFVTIFLCKPISHFWHPERPGHCLEQLPIWFFNTCFSIVTDIAVAVLPLPVVNSLRLPKRQKCILMVIFAMGGSVCLISIVRFYSLYAVVRNDDDTWEAPQATVYSSIEALVAIISGCLPTYNAFTAKHFPGLHVRYARPRSREPTLPSIIFSMVDSSSASLNKSQNHVMQKAASPEAHVAETLSTCKGTAKAEEVQKTINEGEGGLHPNASEKFNSVPLPPPAVQRLSTP